MAVMQQDPSGPAPAQSRRLPVAALLVCTAALCWLSIHLFRAPQARDASAPASVFSAARAMAVVERIARVPHPRGSAALAVVRDDLVAQVRALGFEPELERGILSHSPRHPPVEVENILVRIPGTAPTRAVLLCAHYDSVRGGPGAADNGAAVASLIETLRALKAGPPLRNDLILLFSDNEEYGSEGALLFITRHPWFKDVGLVFNFDARGSRGPSIMFETSPNNAALVSELARGVPHVIATSLSMEVYRHMPNGTDFTWFKNVGCEGLNFAFIEGPETYHRPGDTPANLSLDTLQHTGDTMLHLARHFGNLTLPVASSGDAVYFDVLGSWFVHYPENWVKPLALAVLVAALACLSILVRSRQLRLGRAALATLGLLFAAVAAFGCGLLVFVERAFLRTVSAAPGLLLALACLLAALAALLLSRWLARWTSALERQAAAFVVWSALATAGILLPATSYLFLWPALAGWFGLALWRGLAHRSASSRLARLAAAFARLLGPWTAVMFLSPLAFVLWIAFPPALPVVALFVALALWPLLAAVEAD